MKLDKFSTLGSPEIEESEISPPTAAPAGGSQGRNADGQGGGEGGGLQLPPLRRLPFLIVSPVQLYQMEFQCATWTVLLFLNSPILKKFA